MDAQTAFLNDMSKSMFRSFQEMCNLNIQLVQTMLEETTTAGQQLLTADRQHELWTAAASRAQPVADKMRAYQQHISRLAADAQVDMARVTEQHVQNTSRTARTLADEVARTTSEETERGLRAQQETVRKFADPFTHSGNGSAGQAQWADAGATMQSAGEQAGAQGASIMQQGASTMQQGASAMQQGASTMQQGAMHGNGGAGSPTPSAAPQGGRQQQQGGAARP
jgi:phasin family protein